MTLDYVALAKWGLVPALGTIITITLGFAYKLYYKELKTLETKVRNKVRTLLITEVGKFDQITSKNLKGEQEFSDMISIIVGYNPIYKEAKKHFEVHMFYSAILFIVLGVLFVLIPDLGEALLLVGAMTLTYHLGSMFSFRHQCIQLQNFLKVDDAKELMEEE